MDIKWLKTKNYSFSCSKMVKPYDICDTMANIGSDLYVYKITYNNITIKIGKSNDQSTNFGDRLYRQIGHLYSWGRDRITGPNDITFEEVDEKFHAIYGEYIDHRNLRVDIWDFTNYPFETINKDKELKDAEREMIEAYTKFYRQLPVGNIDDMQHAKRKSAPRKAVCDNLFEEI